MKLQGAVNAAVIGIVVILVLFNAYAAIVPDAQDSGDEMTNDARCTTAGGIYCTNLTPTGCYALVEGCNTSMSGVHYSRIPLGDLFSDSGVVFVLVMSGLLLVGVKGFIAKGK